MTASDDVVLSYIYNNEDINQRQLMEKTSLSLGSINIILHRLVNRGLVKIEKVSARQLKYILTPQGIARCTRKTVNFVKHAYIQILKLQGAYKKIVAKAEEKDQSLYLFGDRDEIYQILIQATHEQSPGQVFYVDDIRKVKKDSNPLIIVWQEKQEKDCLAARFPCINIIRELDPTEVI
jgi:DNA-binding MarR family transcriptional regulator